MKKLFAFLTVMLLSESLLLAQTVSVKGTVIDTEGGVVVGAVILVAGTDIVSMTDAQGQYTIQA